MAVKTATPTADAPLKTNGAIERAQRELKAEQMVLGQAQKRLRSAIVNNSGIADAKAEVVIHMTKVETLEATILGLQERQEDQHAATIEADTQAQHDRQVKSVEQLRSAIMKGWPLFATIDTYVQSVITAADGCSRGFPSDIVQQVIATRLHAAHILELYALLLRTGNHTIQRELGLAMARLEKGVPTVDQVP
jgi:hypothetical protein